MVPTRPAIGKSWSPNRKQLERNEKMTRKLLLLLGGVLFATQAAFADTETVGGIEWTYTVSDGKAEVLV